MNLSFWLSWFPTLSPEKGERMGHGIGTKSDGQRPSLFTCRESINPIHICRAYRQQALAEMSRRFMRSRQCVNAGSLIRRPVDCGARLRHPTRYSDWAFKRRCVAVQLRLSTQPGSEASAAQRFLCIVDGVCAGRESRPHPSEAWIHPTDESLTPPQRARAARRGPRCLWGPRGWGTNFCD